LKRAGALAGVAGLGSIFKYSTQWFLISPNKPPTVSDQPKPDWSDATVQSYKELGRTGWKMSDISFGTGGLRDPEVLRLALDRGVNYIDTSPDYSDSESELSKAVSQDCRPTISISVISTPSILLIGSWRLPFTRPSIV
jgi:hypothetical protein